MTFASATIDWFLGKATSHMGAFQYAAHAGQRDGVSTSGAELWAKAEAERAISSGNMVNAETHLLNQVATEIADYIHSDLTVVELGAGTLTAFKNKTLPIIKALGCRTAVLVDESTAFLKQISYARDLPQELKIQSIIDDFFENDTAYTEQEALVCSFGSTISNIISPASDKLPQAALVAGLSKLAHAANNGYMLIGFDSDQNGEQIKAYFRKHALFQLNIFDRMAAELSIKGDFDPKAFSYEPEWIASSGQLVHTAIVNRDMAFKINETPIVLTKGQKLHIKNSYKFTPEFFEKCCEIAGLHVVHAWGDSSSAKVYLLRIEPTNHAIFLGNAFAQTQQSKTLIA